MPSNSSFKPNPLRGLACAVRFTTPFGRYAGRLNSGVRAHMKASSLLVVILASIVTGCATTKHTAVSPVSAPASELSGDAAIQCGTFDLPKLPDQAKFCAQQADSRSMPFWVALHPQGIDSNIWVAIGRNSASRRYVVMYDSDPSGGSNVGATISTTYCDGEFDWEPVIGCK